MCAAAEFYGHIAHFDNADDIAVLLTEEGGGAHLLCLLNRKLHCIDIGAVEDHVGHKAVDLCDLLNAECGEMGKVKAQMVRLNQRTRLMHMVAEHLDERRLEQVRCAVCAADGLAALGINADGDSVAELDLSALDKAVVHELAALVLLDVIHSDAGAFGTDEAVVRDLTAHLGVHGCLIENDYDLLARLCAAAQLLVRDDCEDLRITLVVFVADKLRLRDLFAEVDSCPAEVAQRLSRLSRANALFFHECLEARLVNAHALILAHLDGEVNGEAVGVVELECIAAGKDRLALCLVLIHQVGENFHTGVDCAGEVLLLYLDNAGDVILLLTKLGVLALVLVDNGVDDLVKERLVHSQKLAVACRAAEQAAQNVASALVGGENAVADHEGRASDMVGDNAQRHVHLVRLAVVCARQLADLVGNVHDGVHVEEGVNALTHDRKTLKAHAGVDILLFKLGIVVVAVVVKLGKDVVPDLHVSVTVTADGAVRLAAAVLLAAVKVYLGAGAAGTGAVLPEVVLLAEAENTLRRDADLLVPDIKRLIVINVDGGIESVGIYAYPLG